ncbi:hypothetical protein ARMSODRAFT_628157 [Armillaria solidipes]|uniref:Uncharacterized protein n=1 Tax=Armillaria solidipes TaxID=1076256 RepID=A0A2H3BR13_9AGAR|nr:hypothetical protein ARMSODRAFT_628157 [Armillaria solidipes]
MKNLASLVLLSCTENSFFPPNEKCFVLTTGTLFSSRCPRSFPSPKRKYNMKCPQHFEVLFFRKDRVPAPAVQVLQCETQPSLPSLPLWGRPFGYRTHASGCRNKHQPTSRRPPPIFELSTLGMQLTTLVAPGGEPRHRLCPLDHDRPLSDPLHLFGAEIKLREPTQTYK